MGAASSKNRAVGWWSLRYSGRRAWVRRQNSGAFHEGGIRVFAPFAGTVPWPVGVGPNRPGKFAINVSISGFAKTKDA